MKVAIIGASGSMGSALTLSLAKAGHEIFAYAPNAEKLASIVEKIRKEVPNAKIVQAADSAGAARSADVVIPAVWYSVQGEVAREIAAVAEGKIVVNICNPLNSTYDGLVTAPTTSAAEEFAKLLPKSKVVKAFNTAFAVDYASPDFAGMKPDIFLAGDDGQAVEKVSSLVADCGFNPLYAGKLQASRILENMTVLLIALTKIYGYANWVAGWKVLHK